MCSDGVDNCAPWLASWCLLWWRCKLYEFEHTVNIWASMFLATLFQLPASQQSHSIRVSGNWRWQQARCLWKTSATAWTDCEAFWNTTTFKALDPFLCFLSVFIICSTTLMPVYTGAPHQLTWTELKLVLQKIIGPIGDVGRWAA